MNCPAGSHDDPAAPFNERPPQPCPVCNGEGFCEGADYYDEEGNGPFLSPCPRCEGEGTI